MPKPTCIQCNADDSLLWRNAGNGQICNDCHLANAAKESTTAVKSEVDEKREDKEDDKNGKSEVESTPAKATGKGTRKSTRSTRYKSKTPAPVPGGRPPAPRGRGRRSIFKRQPLKAPTATATVVTGDSVFYKGKYMQVGDIVSMIDVDGGIFYAQIRGFVTDQYCEKSAAVTWLLPTTASPPPEKGFDPSTYIIGPEEELPRKLEAMSWVMHAPADYFRAQHAPYPPALAHLEKYTGFIWTTLDAHLDS